VPFAVNAASFVVSAATIRLMRVRFQERRETPPARMTSEIREGLVWLWRRPALRFLTGIQAADNLRYGAGYLVIIVLAKRVGATPVWIGVIFSGAAIGAIVGALVSSRATRRHPPGRIATAMLWVEAAVFPLYAIAPNPLLLGVVAAAESVIAPVFSVAMTTYRLSATPDALRGRVVSAASTLAVGAMSLGAILGGMLLASIGPRKMVLISSLWLLGLAILTTANRTVRRGDAGDAPPAQAEAASAGG
jgi:predicted MFS family arabinose efflux permease